MNAWLDLLGWIARGGHDQAEPDRTGSTFRVDLPCPICGHQTVIGYLYVDQAGRPMHTRYVCTFWQSGMAPNEPCNWWGWSVPGWDAQEVGA